MLVAFWSPFAGHGKTTSNMLAVSSIIGVDYSEIKSLLTTSKLGDTSIDRAFEDLRGATQEEEGAKAIEQLVLSSRLTPQNLQNNSQFIIQNRLDLLSVKRSSGEEVYSRVFPVLIEVANKAYDLVFLDTSSNERDAFSEVVFNKANLIVVCLPQDSFLVEHNITRVKEVVGDKKALYCVGSFDRRSRLSQEKLSRMLKVPTRDICVVPYNISFLDSLNSKNLMKYIVGISPLKKKFLSFDEDVYFLGKVREFSKKILSRLEIVAVKEEDE